MQRNKARIIAIKNVYQMLVNNEPMKDVILQYETNDEFLMLLCNGVAANLEMLDLEISTHLKKGWSMNRLNTIDRAILLVAAYELIFTDLDRKIVINEAVEIAKTYCDDDRYKFINGTLDKIGK